MTKRQRLFAELVLIAALILALHQAGNLGEAFLIGTFDDDGVYTVLGKALATGQGYHSLHLIGAPVQVKYPPGLPWILSLGWRATGSPEGILGLVGWLHPLVLAAAGCLLWWLARGRWGLDWGTALLLVVLPLVLDATIQYTAIPLAEPWFVLGWALVLAAWEAADATTGRHRLPLFGLCGLALAATVLTRAQGIVLLPALILALAGRRYRWPERGAVLAMALIPLVAWHLYHRALIAAGPVADLPDEGTYAAWFGGGGSRLMATGFASMMANTRFYIEQLGAYVTGIRPLGMAVMTVILLAAVSAALMLVRRRPLLAVGALASLGLVLLWPFAQDRLLLSTLPFTGLLTAAALQPSLARVPAKVRRWLPLGCVVAFVLVLVRQVDLRRDSLAAVIENRAPALLSPAYGLVVNSRFVATASHWILEHTAPDARVMIDHQSGIYLYTGRRTLPASPSESRFVPSVFAVPGQYLARHILRDSLTLIIVGLKRPGIMRDIATVKERCPGVLTWGGVSPADPPDLYRVTPDSTCLRGLAEAAVAVP